MTSVKEIQSVRNACRVFEEIARLQPIGVSELARGLQIDKSAVHRIAITLHAAGWLSRTPDGRWSVAPSLAPAMRQSAVESLVTSARPLLEAAQGQTGELAMLVIPQGQSLIIADAIDSPHELRVTVRIGSEMPARSSSALRILAAHASAEELAAWREVDPGLTDSVLASARAQGWARNDGEVIDGTRAVGAALQSLDGTPLGALVVCGPAHRFQGEPMRSAGEAVARLARAWAANPPGADR